MTQHDEISIANDWQMKKCFEVIRGVIEREGIAFQLSNLPFDVPFHSISLRDLRPFLACV